MVVQLIKNYQTQMETLKQSAARRAEARSKSSEDYHSESPGTPRAPGFLDFTSPPKGKDSKKKRQLPIAPRRKGRTASGEGEGRMVGVFFIHPVRGHHKQKLHFNRVYQWGKLSIHGC